MAKCYVEGPPAEVKAALPPGSNVRVSDADFFQEKRQYSLVSCAPADDSALGRPSEACAAHLRKVFAGRRIVACADFTDDEAAAPPLF